ncbi:hypothetical protein [Hymenobacter sp. AT01-02]|uniref:hypothetical protein n=1 Tax=Hymenobacter sp. AT01-02 TaxID=1571877 RepID=UPI0005F1B081|nr:hypothetical protein [Hymenobacter sp. AT01-02]
MPDHLQAFLTLFLAKCYQSTEASQPLQKGNPMLGLDNLSRRLDLRYCIHLPKGSKQQDIAFVRQAITPYHLTACYVLSAYEPLHKQTMSIAEALEAVVGESNTTLLSFIPGKVAYFEGHSVGDRFLCIR